MLVLGADLDARDVPAAWSIWRAQEAPDHRWLIPFEQLPRDVADLDLPFAEVLRSIARADTMPPSH